MIAGGRLGLTGRALPPESTSLSKFGFSEVASGRSRTARTVLLSAPGTWAMRLFAQFGVSSNFYIEPALVRGQCKFFPIIGIWHQEFHVGLLFQCYDDIRG